MKNNFIRFAALSFALLLLLSLFLTACGGNDGVKAPDNTAAFSEQTDGETTEPEYIFPELDLGGKKFTMLNMTPGNSYSYIDVELSGDVLDDAMWKRNSDIEETFIFDLVEVNKTSDEIQAAVRECVLSGDDVYQVAYPLTYHMGGMLTDRLFWDLREGDGFAFDEPWWDQAIMEDVPFGPDKSIFFASSDISLHNFEMSWCFYFNRNMVLNHQLDLPYDAVNEGRWTYDLLYEYTSVAHNLNGDDSYAWNPEGSSVYGFTSMHDCIYQSFIACGEPLIEMNDGAPVMTAGSDRFYKIAEKLTKVYGTAGLAVFGNDRNNKSHYEMVFAAQRAMFVGAEIKSGDGGGVFAEMENDYGIVPLPKFDEEQEGYVSPVAVWTYFITVPVSNGDLDTTSIILDALSYLSYRDVIPAYYDVTLSVKNIRDKETADMLAIIRDCRTYFTAYAFGWGADFRSQLSTRIVSGSSDLASVIAAEKPKIEAQIQTSLDAMS